jgi:NitT/TauT family transport system permease protein
MATDRDVMRLEEEIAGLDALDIVRTERTNRTAQIWSALWPKLAAVAIFFAIWQIVDWSNWREDFALPGPTTVLPDLARLLRTSEFWRVTFATTMRRAFTGYGLAVVLGTALGLGVSRSSIVRRALGSFITGLQTMPSVVWFPLAILVFGPEESAILFVVVLGAFPSVANGLVSGVDHIPPLYLRAGRVLGARGLSSVRHVVLPAALPAYVAGLKQGWAFMWRSLLAGELIVSIGARSSLGAGLFNAGAVNDATHVMAFMIVIFMVGVFVDGFVFSRIEKTIRRRRGLIEVGATA